MYLYTVARMAYPLVDKKIRHIKANCTDTSAVKRGSMVVMTVCFNIRILKSAFAALVDKLAKSLLSKGRVLSVRV